MAYLRDSSEMCPPPNAKHHSREAHLLSTGSGPRAQRIHIGCSPEPTFGVRQRVGRGSSEIALLIPHGGFKLKMLLRPG